MNKSGSFLSVSIALTIMLCLDYGFGESIKPIPEAHAASATVTPMEGKAVIVFVRAFSPDATSVDYRQSPLFKLKSNESEPELIGILSVKTKLAYQVDPGQHLFMVIGENADFMTAEVLPNRIYYVLVLARVGNRAAIYSLKAVDKQAQISKDFEELFASSKLVENTPASLNWASSNRATIKSKQFEYYRVWTQKPDSERTRLLPDHGTGGRP